MYNKKNRLRASRRANPKPALTKGIERYVYPERIRPFLHADAGNPRLTLRRMTMKDAKDVFEYSRDADVARHVLWSAQKDIGEAKDYCRYMTRRYRADEPSSWGIVDKKTGHLVGTIGYMNYDMDNASVEIGYSLAKWMWNGGYMTEALRRVIDYTFDAMDINRIEAQHELDNPASGRVMEKCGMRKEGVLRQRLYNKGNLSMWRFTPFSRTTRDPRGAPRTMSARARHQKGTTI
ncbi:MAG: GNAT family N-acetyltransferase [Christensenellales bacterium]